MKILFIGNSHTYVNVLPMVVKYNSDIDLEVNMIARPGITFHDHLEDPSVHFALRGDYDIVIIQQAAHSPCPSKEETLRDGKTLIEEAIHFGKEVYVVIPWAHKGRNEDFEVIKDIYATLIQENPVKGIPTGYLMQALWDELDLYLRDDEHLSPIGTYLHACMILKTLFNQVEYHSTTIASIFETNFDPITVESTINDLITKSINK